MPVKSELSMWPSDQSFQSSVVTTLQMNWDNLCTFDPTFVLWWCMKCTSEFLQLKYIPQKLPQRKEWFKKYSIYLFFIKIFICIQVNNHHTLYQYVTERHPKNKISGFLTGSIHSLWLSQNNTIYTENGERYEYNGWNNYWWVDLLFVACKLLLLPPALSSVLSRCFSASFLIAAWTLPSPPTSSSF